MTEYFSPERALSVRLSVCLSVCHSLLFEHYSGDFDEIWTTWSYHKIEMTLFSDLKMLLRWRHGGHFVCLWMRHSHGLELSVRTLKKRYKRFTLLPVQTGSSYQKNDIFKGNNSSHNVHQLNKCFPRGKIKVPSVLDTDYMIDLDLGSTQTSTWHWVNLNILFISIICDI